MPSKLDPDQVACKPWICDFLLYSSSHYFNNLQSIALFFLHQSFCTMNQALITMKELQRVLSFLGSLEPMRNSAWKLMVWYAPRNIVHLLVLCIKKKKRDHVSTFCLGFCVVLLLLSPILVAFKSIVSPCLMSNVNIPGAYSCCVAKALLTTRWSEARFLYCNWSLDDLKC